MIAGRRGGEPDSPDGEPGGTGGEPGAASGLPDRPPAAPGGGGSARRRAGGGPWKAGFFALAAAGIVGVAIWAILTSSLLVVRTVTVTGSGTLPRAQVVRAAAIAPGTPLARLNTALVARHVEAIAQIRSATVSKHWPDSVVISVTLRRPAMAVAAPGGGYTLIDSSGVAIGQVQALAAGTAVLSPPPAAAALRGSPAVRAAAAVLGQLPPQLRSRVTAVSVPSPPTVTLHLRGHITVVWGEAGRARDKAAELAILMQTHATFYDVSDPATAVTGG